MAVLMQVMLNGGGYGKVKLFDKQTIKGFTESSAEDATFGLGWRVNGNASMTPTFGVLASKETHGHTGWKGTLTAIDPVSHMAIFILGNRPHSPIVAREPIQMCLSVHYYPQRNTAGLLIDIRGIEVK